MRRLKDRICPLMSQPQLSCCFVCGRSSTRQVLSLRPAVHGKEGPYICSISCLEAVAEQQAELFGPVVRKRWDNDDAFRWRYVGISLPLSAYVRAIPDEFLVLGKDLHPIRVLLLDAESSATGTPVHFPADLDRLAAVCQQAPFGRGRETVVDTSVRRVLETDRCKIEWEGMPRVLAHISERLALPQNIRADFYKLLYYCEGDFFLEHMDSKKSAAHALTLAVDIGSECAGGDLVFPVTSMASPRAADSRETKDGLHSSSQEKELRWVSNGGAGSYACWFTAQKHSVEKVTSGYRLVAVYNVQVPDVADFKAQLPPPQISAASSESAPLLQLPTDVLRLIMAGLIQVGGLGAVAKLARTCKALCGIARNRAWLLAAWISGRRSAILKTLNKAICNSVSFVLQHKYSFDGQPELPLCRLRGRDRVLAEAFVLSGLGKVSVRPVFVRVERYDRDINETDMPFELVEFRVARSISNTGFCSTILATEKPLMPSGYDSLPKHDYERFTFHTVRTHTENDGDIRERFWPFWHTQFLSDFDYMCCLHQPANNDDSCRNNERNNKRDDEDEDYYLAPSEASISKAENFIPDVSNSVCDKPEFVGKQETIWGNGPIFGLYWYYEAALFVELPIDPPSTAALAEYFSRCCTWGNPRLSICQVGGLPFAKSLSPPAPGPANV